MAEETVKTLASRLEQLIPGPASEERFWRRAKEIDWGKHAPRRMRVDIAGLRRRLASSVSAAELVALSNRERALYGKLRARIQEWEEQQGGQQISVGDDGFMDLVHHIVGLGRESYEATLAKPSLARDRAHRGSYCECFGYVFHFSDDGPYRPGDLAGLIARASQVRPYSPKERYDVGDGVEHPTFGRGVVIATDGPHRAYVSFEQDERALSMARA